MFLCALGDHHELLIIDWKLLTKEILYLHLMSISLPFHSQIFFTIPPAGTNTSSNMGAFKELRIREVDWCRLEGFSIDTIGLYWEVLFVLVDFRNWFLSIMYPLFHPPSHPSFFSYRRCRDSDNQHFSLLPHSLIPGSSTGSCCGPNSLLWEDRLVHVWNFTSRLLMAFLPLVLNYIKFRVL